MIEKMRLDKMRHIEIMWLNDVKNKWNKIIKEEKQTEETSDKTRQQEEKKNETRLNDKRRKKRDEKKWREDDKRMEHLRQDEMKQWVDRS